MPALPRQRRLLCEPAARVNGRWRKPRRRSTCRNGPSIGGLRASTPGEWMQVATLRPTASSDEGTHGIAGELATGDALETVASGVSVLGADQAIVVEHPERRHPGFVEV